MRPRILDRLANVMLSNIPDHIPNSHGTHETFVTAFPQGSASVVHQSGHRQSVFLM